MAYAFNKVASLSSSDIDELLRFNMRKTYNTMALGVAVTGLVIMALANTPDLLLALAAGPMKWVLFGVVLGLGFFSHKIMTVRSTPLAHVMYWGYVVAWGAMIAPMVIAYTTIGDGIWDVARAFLITAVMFLSASIYGYSTKRNLSAFGTFFMLASIGLIAAMLINLFLFDMSTTFSFVISAAVVLLFSAMTAWETQMIKEFFVANINDTGSSRMAVFGAFMLYGSFVSMFIHILNILSILRGEE